MEKLAEIQEYFELGVIEALNTGHTNDGEFQVSIRRPKASGWEVYFGTDLGETMLRACEGGVQRILPVVDAYQMELWR